uniref:Uncharacterized protein n=1 Tax=Zea mays TaxID=4577 RepID=A0A804UHR7_MAIZE
MSPFPSSPAPSILLPAPYYTRCRARLPPLCLLRIGLHPALRRAFRRLGVLAPSLLYGVSKGGAGRNVGENQARSPHQSGTRLLSSHFRLRFPYLPLEMHPPLTLHRHPMCAEIIEEVIRRVHIP